MSEAELQNPFAPPRAVVDDPVVRQEQIVPAERVTRLLAFLVDTSPAIVVGIVIGIAMAISMPFLFQKGATPRLSGFNPALGVAIGVLVLAIVAWVIYNIALVYRQGQTFGKKIMGIRMVRTDGSRMSFARYFFLRNLAYGILCAIPFVGWPLRLIDKLLIFRDSRKCLHDNIADTIVVTAESSVHATLAGSRGEHLRSISF